MKRGRNRLLIAAACLLLLTGCWNRRELNTIGIAVGLGVDRAGDKYDISVQIVNPTQVSSKKSDNQAKVSLYSAKSHTVFEARHRLSIVSPRIINFSHLRILVISEEQARKGIMDVLDFLSRYYEIRADFFVVIARDFKASELLSVITQMDSIPAMRMYNMLDLSGKLWAPTIGITLNELLESLGNTSGKSSVLSGISLKGNVEKIKTPQSIELIQPPGRMYFSGIAVMKKDQLAGWLDERDSESYAYLVNKVDRSAIEVACGKEGKVVLGVMKTKSKYKATMADGRPAMKIKVNLTTNIGEAICDKSIYDEGIVEELQQTASRMLKQQFEETVKHVQTTYRADIFGFGETIYRSYPKQWKGLENDWEQQFAQLPVDIEVKVKILHTGSVNEQLSKKGRD